MMNVLSHKFPKAIAIIAATLNLSGLTMAADWIVDVNNGHGTDFTSIVVAVGDAAVQNGDTLLVRPGSYAGFDTDKVLSIIGEFSGGKLKVRIQNPSTVSIHDLPAGTWSAFANFRLDDLIIDDCDGALIVKNVHAKTARFSDCADVRMESSRILARTQSTSSDPDDGDDAIIISGSSQVEIVRSLIRGGPGQSSDDGGDGGRGIWVVGTSKVQIALSKVKGGDGGLAWTSGWIGGDPGNGADALRIESLAEGIILGGTSNSKLIEGVGGYDAAGYGGYGLDGEGLSNMGTTRMSGVQCNNIVNQGYLEQPSPADPSLKQVPLAGSHTRVTVFGAPGSTVRLHVGTEPTLSPAKSLEPPAMNDSTWTLWVGVIGPSGKIRLDLDRAFPMEAGARRLYVLQASAFNGGKRLTNSVSFF